MGLTLDDPVVIVSNFSGKALYEFSVCLCRELYDASIRAYVSFVRFYHKHELQLIFNLKGIVYDHSCVYDGSDLHITRSRYDWTCSRDLLSTASSKDA